MPGESESATPPTKGAARTDVARRSAAQRKKSAAKAGMTLSMAALVATGLMRGGGARTLHLWSGIALVGFSAWHYALYQPLDR